MDMVLEKKRDVDRNKMRERMVCNAEITRYRAAVRKEMIKMGASEKELRLIEDATIRNAIRRQRKPEDVAWALMQ